MTNIIHAQTRRDMPFRISNCKSSFLDAVLRKPKHNDEGSMLVEVLVALLILVVVFTAAVLALSNMASQRVAIEQRDRAVRLLTEYEELSRILRCGYTVDRDDVSITVLQDKVNSCDFRAQASGGTPQNAGDQDFRIEERDRGRVIQTFDISIRYWWEVPGSTIHNSRCDDIRETAELRDEGLLPSIAVRAFEIRWREKGKEEREVLIKKDPVPVDSAVFAVGNRINILYRANDGGSLPATVPSTTVSFVPQGSLRIDRIVDNVFPQQPKRCVWFPYINPDGQSRTVGGSPVIPDPAITGPGKAIVR